jgi:hypothetical protein
MDNLEKRIGEVKKELDTLVPGEKVWQGIEKELESQIKPIIINFKSRNLIWKIAAGLTGILVIFWIGFWTGTNNKGQESSLPPQFQEAEQFYLNKIETKKVAVFSYQLDEDMAYQFKKDLTVLDSIYQDLRNMYELKGAQPRLLENMILNLQKQSKILELQLEIINKQNSRGHEIKQISA